MTLQLSPETDCCGIEFIYNFPIASYGEDKKAMKERVEKEFDNALSEYDEDCQYEYRGGCGIFLVALTQYQYPIYKDFLRRHKFGMLKTFYNPNTGNTIKLLGRLRNQPRKKRKK